MSQQECGEAKSSKSSKALASRAQGKLATASDFLAVPDSVTGKGTHEERPQHGASCQAGEVAPTKAPTASDGDFQGQHG